MRRRTYQNLSPEHRVGYKEHQRWLQTCGKEGKQLCWGDKSFCGVDLAAMNFDKAQLFRVTFTDCCLDRSTFINADLRDAIFDDVHGIGVCFDGADMDSMSIRNSELRLCNFNRANMTEVLIGETDLHGADFTRANLSVATCRHVNFSRAIFCNAIIDGMDLGVEAIGGPGKILCALTPDEWKVIWDGRNKQ